MFEETPKLVNVPTAPNIRTATSLAVQARSLAGARKLGEAAAAVVALLRGRFGLDARQLRINFDRFL